MGNIVDKVSIERILEGMGVPHIATLDPLKLDACIEKIREYAALPGVKAIIFKSPCIAISRPTGKMQITGKCIQCKKCIRELGCPALTTVDGIVSINPELCTGCGLCSQICPVAAIEGGADNE